MPAKAAPFFDYLIPNEIGEICPGALVRIPFRKSILLGIVRKIKKSTQTRNLKAIACVQTVQPVIDDFGWVFFDWLCGDLCIHPSMAASQIFGRLPSRQKEAVFSGLNCRSIRKGKQKLFWYTREEELLDELSNARDVLMLCPSITRAQSVHKKMLSLGKDVFLITHDAGKNDWLAAIKDGAASIIVGTRVASFLPRIFSKIIIIDEDDQDHKQSEMNPRYDARRIAYQRSRLFGSDLLITSVCPRLVSYKAVSPFVKEKQDGADIEPPRRIVLSGKRDIFSLSVTDLAEKYLEKEKSVLFYHGSKGFGRLLRCDDCGNIITCPNCSFPVRPSRENFALCIRCLKETDAALKCPACRGVKIRVLGLGIDRLKAIAHDRFPAYKTKIIEDVSDLSLKNTLLFSTKKLLRLSLDVSETSIGAIIIPIQESLFGTKSYLASEQAVAAVRRLGIMANNWGAEFLIQSFNRETLPVTKNEIIRWRQDESERRKKFGYPPFGQLFRLLLQGKNNDILKAKNKLCESELGSYLFDPDLWSPRAKNRISRSLYIKLPKNVSSKLICDIIKSIGSIHLDRDPQVF